ncbi:MAG TPA: hypothetical protein VME68_15395 [Acidobacteriaceae bacterium]|nr:hypothetical protein [Acidobacteriaceae bacterium]
MRDYGLIYTRYWIDPEIMRASAVAKCIGVYLLSSPHTNMIGCFRLPMAYLAADMGMGIETVSEGLAELLRAGFATYDEQSAWIVLPRFLKWNPIENPNQGKAAVKLFGEVPANSLVFKPLVLAMLAFGDKLPELFKRRLETLCQEFRNQE